MTEMDGCRSLAPYPRRRHAHRWRWRRSCRVIALTPNALGRRNVSAASKPGQRLLSKPFRNRRRPARREARWLPRGEGAAPPARAAVPAIACPRRTGRQVQGRGRRRILSSTRASAHLRTMEQGGGPMPIPATTVCLSWPARRRCSRSCGRPPRAAHMAAARLAAHTLNRAAIANIGAPRSLQAVRANRSRWRAQRGKNRLPPTARMTTRARVAERLPRTTNVRPACGDFQGSPHPPPILVLLVDEDPVARMLTTQF